jgi:PAS domain-containing protein
MRENFSFFSGRRALPTYRMMPPVPAQSPAAPAPRSRDLNAVIVETSASLIVVLDVNGRIVRFNHACEQATGYAADEALGRVFWDLLLDPEAAARARELLAGLAAGPAELP